MMRHNIRKINPVIIKRLVTAWLTMFVMGSDLFVISPILPLIAMRYGVSPATAGLSVTVFSLIYMVGAPFFGRIADRAGRRLTLLICLGVFAGANVFTAAAGNFGLLLGARFLAGGAAAGVSPSVYALVGASAPLARRGTHLAIVVSGLLTSLMLAAPVAALTGAAIGWQSVFFALAIASLVMVWMNLRAWPDNQDPGDRSAPADRTGIWVLCVRLIPTLIWSMAVYGAYTYLGAGLTLSGYPREKLAAAIILYGGGSLIGVLAGGRVSDRFGERLTTTIGLAGLAIAFILLHLAFATGILVVWAFGLVSVVAQIFFPAQQAALAKDFPARRATALAWNNSALFLGISLGSLVGGQAVRVGGFGADLLVSAAIAVGGCVFNALLLVRSRAEGT